MPAPCRPTPTTRGVRPVRPVTAPGCWRSWRRTSDVSLVELGVGRAWRRSSLALVELVETPVVASVPRSGAAPVPPLRDCSASASLCANARPTPDKGRPAPLGASDGRACRPPHSRVRCLERRLLLSYLAGLSWVSLRTTSSRRTPGSCDPSRGWCAAGPVDVHLVLFRHVAAFVTRNRPRAGSDVSRGQLRGRTGPIDPVVGRACRDRPAG
jgi:hypothetical protein